MKKNFTFILLSLLLFVVGGVSAQTTYLYLNGGHSWEASDGVHEWRDYQTNVTYTSGNVKLNAQGLNTSSCGLTGSNWIETVSSGDTHTFTVTLSEAPGNNHFVLAGGKPAYGDFSRPEEGDNYKVRARIAADATSATIALNRAYTHVCIMNTEASNETIKIASITRTISGAVSAPTITPASGTYDGELSVTITPGDGNDNVTYSISGATTGGGSGTIYEATTFNLTGTSTITVTAKGYDSEDNESDEVTNTFTYSIPSGKGSASITYYALSGVLMEDGTSRAFYDFEDGVTPGANNSSNPLRVSDNFTGGTSNLSIVDCDADHISATGSTKCLKIDFSGKGDQAYYDSQINLFFKEALTKDHTYYVHFWTKAETHVNDTGNTLVEFQRNGKNGGGWDRSHINSDVDYDTSWHEYMYEIQPSRDDATMMCFDLGTVKNNVLYIDDIAVFDATSGTTPVSFSDLKSTAVISSSAFSDFAVGDYIQLNVTGSPSAIGYKSHASNDEYKVPYLAEYTDLEQTNGNWLIPVTSDIKSNGLSIKGYPMTLSSVNLFKKVVLDQDVDNTVTKYDNVAVYLDRTFEANTWNTVCLPFALTADQAEELFGSGYKIAKFTGISGTTMEFTSKDAEAFDFEAGQPYLVKPTADLNTPVVLADVNITAKNGAPVTHDGYSFTGTFTTKSFAEGERATTRFVATGNKLNTPNNGNAMKALRCYFTVPAKSSARGYAIDGFMDDDVPTDISATLNDNVQTTKVIYNLAGQRVANPTKGLYIVNGQKVVVK